MSSPYPSNIPAGVRCLQENPNSYSVRDWDSGPVDHAHLPHMPAQEFALLNDVSPPPTGASGPFSEFLEATHRQHTTPL